MPTLAMSYTSKLSEKEKKSAKRGLKALEALNFDNTKTAKKENTVEMMIENQEVEMPLKALPILQEILSMMAEGKIISFEEPSKEMTTQEAADFLNVSRPFFIKLLEQKKIPFHKVGNRRKVKTTDVIAYDEKIKNAREKALSEMVALSQEMEGEDY